MFINLRTLAFSATLVGGTVVAATANSWLTAWAGLEINLIRLIPLLIATPSKSSTERAIKYFLPQAMASTILIAASVANYATIKLTLTESLSTIILACLIIKLGAAPLHFWFPQVVAKSPWSQALVILTWQKIAPLTLIAYFKINELVTIFTLASGLMGALGGLNQTSIKLMLTYSSISHTGWMIPLSATTIKVWANYFIIYTINSLLLIFILKTFKLNNINQLFTPSLTTPQLVCTLAPILSMGGLPPLAGFYAKLTAIVYLIKIKAAALLIIILASSLISLFYYLKIAYRTLLISPARIKTIPLLSRPLEDPLILTGLVFGVLMTPAITALL